MHLKTGPVLFQLVALVADEILYIGVNLSQDCSGSKKIVKELGFRYD